MADYYIDYSTGDDTTGAGTSGNPWKTLQKAIDNAAGGDTIWVANTSAQVVSAQISWSSGWSGGTGAEAPLIIRGWDNGGSITISFPGSNYTGVGEIDGSGQAFSPLFSTTSQPTNLLFYRIKFTGSGNTSGANVWVRCYTNWQFVECEFHPDTASTYACGNASDLTFLGCYFHTSSTSSGVASLTTNTRGSFVGWCYFNVAQYAIYSVRGVCCNNVLKGNGVSGSPLMLTGNPCIVFGNTFDSNGARTTNLLDLSNNANDAWNFAINNILVGASGVGGVGVAWRAAAWFGGNNHFYNNTTNQSNSPGIAIGTDQTTDPTFTDASSADYSVGANAKAKGYPGGFTGSSTYNYLDMGAAQRQEAGGGGGVRNPLGGPV